MSARACNITLVISVYARFRCLIPGNLCLPFAEDLYPSCPLLQAYLHLVSSVLILGCADCLHCNHIWQLFRYR
jgi:hypothetical protein